MITISLVLLLAVSSMSAPSPQLPPGIDAATCPNYPFCGAGPASASPQDAVSVKILTSSLKALKSVTIVASIQPPTFPLEIKLGIYKVLDPIYGIYDHDTPTINPD